ncbi:unnamed protein product [Moneuplotes crassus]|uniref:Uncharacterized protein n=1 Tax=Euplotes crassus TaxID=5936 RepID=A0AAD1Y558_EUPCR|nr:unnamed protein product [Moneuplotes crassus]
MADPKTLCDKEDYCNYDDTPEFERSKLYLCQEGEEKKSPQMPPIFTPKKRVEKSTERYSTSKFSFSSNAKLKGFTQEALCQSIELLQLEIKDVKEREKAQEDMYKKIIDALKSEIENSDIAKHIEIINYMHKTEVTHLNKRFDTQIGMKDKHIKELEDKIDSLKDKNKSLETTLLSKTKEFEICTKEGEAKMKEMEIRLKSHDDQRQEFIDKINPEIKQRESHLIYEFENERKRIKSNYEDSIKSLRTMLESERHKYSNKLEKSNETIQKLTKKLAEYRSYKEKESKELNKKLKQSCSKCKNYEGLLETMEAIEMEKDDAYNKIAMLEGEIMQLKALRSISLNKSPDRKHASHKKVEETQGINSSDLSCPKTPPCSSPIQDPKVYQKYRDFQNKFTKTQKMSVYPSQKTIGQGSIEFTNSLSLSKKFDSKPQAEGVKSLSRERNISKSRVQDAKCVPLSTLSTLCKPINTISSQERARNTEESTSICLDKHQDFSSRNENMYSEPKSDLLKKKESKLNIDSGRRGSEHETLIASPFSNLCRKACLKSISGRKCKRNLAICTCRKCYQLKCLQGSIN